MRSSAWRSSLRQIRCGSGTRRLSTAVLVSVGKSRAPQSSVACPACQKFDSLLNRKEVRFYTSSAAAEPGDASTTHDQPPSGQGHRRPPGKRKDQGAPGVPAPPPLPDWFLKYNVRLQTEEFGQDVLNTEARALLLLDPYNDKELLKIPYREPVSPDLKSRQPSTFFDRHEPKEKDGTKADTVSEAPKEEDSHSQKEPPAGAVKEEKLSPPEGLPPQHAAVWARLQGQLLTTALLERTRGEKKKSTLRNLLVLNPGTETHDELDRFVEDVADISSANIVRIDANDIAELAGEYVDAGQTGPNTITGLAYDAYEGVRAVGSMESTAFAAPSDSTEGREDPEQQSRDEGDSQVSNSPFEGLRAVDLIKAARKTLEQTINGSAVIGVGFGLPHQTTEQQSTSAQQDKGSEDDEEPVLTGWQRLKMKHFFNALLNAPSQKADADLSKTADNFVRQKFADLRLEFRNPDMRRELHDASAERREDLIKQYGRKKLATDALRRDLVRHIHSSFGDDKPATAVIKRDEDVNSQSPSRNAIGTIIHVRDIHLIYETPFGEDIINKLKGAVARRQKEGESMILVGTASTFSGDVVTPLSAVEDEFDQEEGFVRLQYSSQAAPQYIVSVQGAGPAGPSSSSSTSATQYYPIQPGYRRILELNLRHIQDAISQLGIEASPNLFSETTRSFLYAPGTQLLGDAVLTQSQIQKIVLTADGFRALYTTSPELDMTHIAIALSINSALNMHNQVARVLSRSFQANIDVNPQPRGGEATGQTRDGKRQDDKSQNRRVDLEEMRRFASKHEQRLFSGIADPATIKTTYNDVHVAPETVDALKTVTTLALLRPQAFSYGVLANDRLPGLLLYGPPGTGKTLLAKAVAKDASATVLEISGAQVYEKYVGEGEKMVKAVFSLAKRLSPCVVFIDEADALFGSRGQSGNRTTHREIINQFLREWDGMDDHRVFIMVATNRPFDLDDAVLRRLPRRILVDLPTVKDREGILKIHLKGEALADDVSVTKLAEQTPFYSGSDLKNVCVAAALAAVKEENELLESHKEDKEFKLPERRTLTLAHFDKATQDISASISEDMRSLTAIKKFDEQYGDRRGRRKKATYGFESMEAKQDESAARVRGDNEQPRP